MKESDPYPMSTLARLSFWVPAARMAEFEVEYEPRLAPILKKHGLVESSEQGRPTVEGVFSQALWPPGALHRHREGGQKTVEGIFSRLFAVGSPAAVAEKEKALQEDPAWREALQELGATLGADTPDGLICHRFWLYQAPAGPGKQVPVGLGKGHWRTFDVTDGLVDMFIRSIFQDREGNLWFSSFSGVGRYDGQQFKSFAIKDGLADNSVSSIAQDREGNL